jgi:hypothetical protein
MDHCCEQSLHVLDICLVAPCSACVEAVYSRRAANDYVHEVIHIVNYETIAHLNEDQKPRENHTA